MLYYSQWHMEIKLIPWDDYILWCHFRAGGLGDELVTHMNDKA